MIESLKDEKTYNIVLNCKIYWSFSIFKMFSDKNAIKLIKQQRTGCIYPFHQAPSSLFSLFLLQTCKASYHKVKSTSINIWKLNYSNHTSRKVLITLFMLFSMPLLSSSIWGTTATKLPFWSISSRTFTTWKSTKPLTLNTFLVSKEKPSTPQIRNPNPVTSGYSSTQPSWLWFLTWFEK